MDRLLRELRKLFILNNEVMQIVPKVVSTIRTTVSVENAKETDLGPFHPLGENLVPWLQNVQNDRDAVLVVLSNDALVCIGSV